MLPRWVRAVRAEGVVRLSARQAEKQSDKGGQIEQYKAKVETELNSICDDILKERPRDSNPRPSRMAAAVMPPR